MSEVAAKAYVLGFAFNELRESVVLIIKDRPEWQKGKHNGVGGKVEEIDETPAHAMVREFKEETGCDTTIDDWNYFAVMTCEEDIMGGRSIIYCFRTFLHHERFRECSTQETERVVRIPASLAMMVPSQFIDKVRYLVPMALENDLDFVEIKMLK